MGTSKFRFRFAAVTADRLRALADGVFAIVMTILVLELAVPMVAGHSINAELTHGLREMWPEFLIYGLSFLVLGVFWIMHHSLFDNIRRYDSPLAWINIFFLMVVALIPFSTALYGHYEAQNITALVYGLNMLLCFAALLGMWVYATGNRRLVDDDIDPRIVKGGKVMGLAYILVTIVGLSLSYVSPIASFSVYGFIVAGFMILTMSSMGVLAMVFPVTDDTQENGSSTETDES